MRSTTSLSPLVAWVCILSGHLVGCYSSSIIEPTGDGKAAVRSGRIFYVVTRDSIRYNFEIRPTVVKDTIVGEGQIPVEGGFIRKQVAIALSDVAYASVKDPKVPTGTQVVVGATVGLAVVVLVAVGLMALLMSAIVANAHP